MNSSPNRGPHEPSENVGTRLLFENERVRVWDLALAPGESLPAHMHRNDYLFIVSQGGTLRHVHPDDPAQDKPVEYEDGLVVFLEAGGGLLHERLVNVGEAPYRNFVIELLKP
jgi:predicted metal-dependent enzyme (double-stranded beta helix superfamily)